MENLNTPAQGPETGAYLPPSELLGKLDSPQDKSDSEETLQEFEHLFENLEKLESKTPDNTRTKESQMEMARQNEFIEREFEQTFIKALIQLRSGIAKAGWPKAFRGAMNMARPELLPVVKAEYPDATEEAVENAFATMAFETIDRIAKGRITTPELEEIRREVANATEPKEIVDLDEHPQPLAFVNAFAKSGTVMPRAEDLNESPIQQTPPRGGARTSN
jgi:hypothetical protein